MELPGLFCFNCRATSKLYSFVNVNKKKLWMEVIPNIKPEDFNVRFRLCSKHFHPMYITKVGGLHFNAVPSKFLVNDSWVTRGIDVNKINEAQPSTQIVPDSPSSDEDTDNVRSEITDDFDLILTNTKKFKSINDIDTNFLYSPTTSRQGVILCKQHILNQLSQIKNLKYKLGRLNKTLHKMDKLLKCLEDKGLIKNRTKPKNSLLTIKMEKKD